MWTRTRRSVLPLLALAVAAPAFPCGPWFPNRMLTGGDTAILKSPGVDFKIELDAIVAEHAGRSHSVGPVNPSVGTAEQDLDDVTTALAVLGLSPQERARLVGAYQCLRGYPCSEDPGVAVTALEGTAGFPRELLLYGRGAAAYNAGDLATARTRWRELLELPAGEQRLRAVWAEYMLGRSQREEAAPAQQVDPYTTAPARYAWRDPTEARSRFARVRELAAAGFPDPLGLAHQSLGWEANFELATGNRVRAVELYVEQLTAGDTTVAVSLQWAIGAALRGGESLAGLVQNPVARRVVTAYLLAQSQGWFVYEDRDEYVAAQAASWLGAAENAGVAGVEGADRLAWLAYETGDYEVARRWLDRAGSATLVTRCLRAKLLLLNGKTEEGTAALAALAAELPKSGGWGDVPGLRRALYPMLETPSGWQAEAISWEFGKPTSVEVPVLGELGSLHLARGEYVASLDELVRGGFWLDAAYVAERVLTVDELSRYVDEGWPQPCASSGLPPFWESHPAFVCGDRGPLLRYLLARRLARDGRFSDALRYAPESLRESLQRLADHLTAGERGDRSGKDRAGDLFAAAGALRDQGKFLTATEVDPDWLGLDLGNFEMDAPDAVRARLAPGRLASPGTGELARATLSRAQPYERFHYRYVAAELAWRAAELLPDGSDATAEVLCTGGSWLKFRDPGAAERFYRALVSRCPATTLGRKAAALRWFPSCR